MRWRCAEGHEWSALPERIRRGAWCPMCAGRTIEGMQALAARHQTGCWCPHCAWDRNAERMRSEAKDRR